MKLQEVILVICILFWACIGSTTVARKTVFVGNLFDGAKKKNSSSVAVFDDVHKCNHKRKHLSSCYNNTSSSEDKRVVPTGPNPLHNR
jgi:hypothetical protein